MSLLRKILCLFVPVFCSVAFARADALSVRQAVSLFEKGLYSQAMTAFQTLPQSGSDPMIDGYTALCAIRLRTDGYRTMCENYLGRYAGSSLCDDIVLEQGLDFFNSGMYREALCKLCDVKLNLLSVKMLPEVVFKKGYCLYKAGRIRDAVDEFFQVDKLPLSDYSAPARYLLGYVCYTEGEFPGAISWLETSASDERFASISQYYIINCNYELKNYDFVISRGGRMVESADVPADRKAHLARIISESYLVRGNKEKASYFYDISDDGSQKSRDDYFFAGSLMYTTDNWQGTVDNYSKVVDRPDSLSQIAWYQMAFSQLKLRNRVAALEDFRNASSMDFDPVMKEDAFFNYAKLAFDLNGDTSVFGQYMKTYADKVRGEKIYSYMALASLAQKDWQSAIDFYDQMDVLEGQDRDNYVKANYLRGAQLLENGSYRNAQQCLKACTYYTQKNDPVNQLARYNLAEAFYRDSQFEQARRQFVELHNNSALDGFPQGRMLPYNAAYSFMREENYDQAAKWFETAASVSGQDGEVIKDAMLRKADSHFAKGDFEEAVKAYRSMLDKYYDVNDIYPYYRCALACGLSKKPKDKLSLLEQALDADPSSPYYPEALFELGKTQQSSKDGRKGARDAAETFRKLMETAPNTSYAARCELELGTILRGQGKYGEALEHYKRVVEELSAWGYVDDALLAIESTYQALHTPKEYLSYLDSIGRGANVSEDDRVNLLFGSAEQLYYAGKYAEAVASFRDFQKTYPDSRYVAKAKYLTAECYRKMGDKPLACDSYAEVIASSAEESLRIKAASGYADLNMELENFGGAYDAYSKLYDMTSGDASSQTAAACGMFRSAYRAKLYDSAIAAADIVLEQGSISENLRREAMLTRSRSLLSVSRRDEAFEMLGSLSSQPKTAEGAEASYLIIQDCYDKADFENLRDRVFSFAQSGTSYQYFLAKSFLLLGDSYAEQGKIKQAEATFRSIAEGYSSDGDEILEEVTARLEKIREMK